MLPVIVNILYYNLHEIELSMKIILQNDMKKKKKKLKEKKILMLREKYEEKGSEKNEIK